jgi:hypothetical protein
MDIEDILVPIAFFGSIVLITKIISDNRLRRRIIDARLDPEMVRALLGTSRAATRRQGALKWGLVAGAIGLALLLIGILSLSGEPLGFGLVTLAAGAGLLVYYAIANRHDGDDDPFPWRVRVERTDRRRRRAADGPYADRPYAYDDVHDDLDTDDLRYADADDALDEDIAAFEAGLEDEEEKEK